MEETKPKQRRIVLWATRIIFAAVFIVNVMCALQFIVDPAAFTSAYQLQGAGAQAAIRGYGVVFLMWNATYPLFIYRPDKHKALGAIILAQQAIGCIGESLILATLPQTGAAVLASSIMRFIIFDVGGLVLMLAAYIVVVRFCKSA